MTFQVSPGVNVTETDLTGIVPAVATTTGAFSGAFRWGPIGQAILLGDEPTLAATFGKPTNFNAETFFTAANFLAYGQSLYVARSANTIGVSNTQSATTQGNTTLLANGSSILGPNTSGLGYSLVGPGIPLNAQVVSWSDNTIIITANATTSTPNTSIVFFNTNAAFSAVASQVPPSHALSSFVVKNQNDYTTKQGTFDPAVQWIAKYPGTLGDSLSISVCDSASQYQSNIVLTGNTLVSTATLAFSVGSNTALLTVANSATGNDITSATFANTVAAALTIGDIILAGNQQTTGLQKINISAIGTAVPVVSGVSNTGTATLLISLAEPYALSGNVTLTTFTRQWEYVDNVGGVPGQTPYVQQFGNSAANDALHAVVVDNLGKFSGTPGAILEVFQSLSRATDAKTPDGSVNYYATVISNNSKYVWFANDRPGVPSANAFLVASSTLNTPYEEVFNYGNDGDDETKVSVGVLAGGIGLFTSSEDIDISLIMAGKARTFDGVAGEQIANYWSDNIVTKRNDCVLFASAPKEYVVNNVGNESTALVTWGNAVRFNTYVVLDSGYKYQYDKYNDVYRWIPLNGDIAGTCAFTDYTKDPWYSPAGFSRGQIKNVVRLAFNPKQADRDLLYKNGINPVVTFPGQGTILYGDKTHAATPSAFDRINVRRLFIVLEKAISTAAKQELFEFNDAFTQANFVNMIDPFLRDVKGRRGIQDYKIVCDSTNNTPAIVDSNQFVATIFIKPNRSINFIQLNFVAVRSGVDFSEIVGQF
jgi:hypothetical protein